MSRKDLNTSSTNGLETLVGTVKVRALEYLWEVKAYEKWPRTVRDVYVKGQVNALCSRTKLKRELDEMVEMGVLEREEILGRGGMKHRYWPVNDRKTTVQVLLFDRLKTLREVARLEGVMFIEYEK